jgi:hypothetical protein
MVEVILSTQPFNEPQALFKRIQNNYTALSKYYLLYIWIKQPPCTPHLSILSIFANLCPRCSIDYYYWTHILFVHFLGSL